LPIWLHQGIEKRNTGMDFGSSHTFQGIEEIPKIQHPLLFFDWTIFNPFDQGIKKQSGTSQTL
jgi:hypothetical protein